MKRMVLIPEERLLRYEERDKQKAEEGVMYGGGGGGGGEEEEDPLSIEMIVRGIPKTMKTRAEALLEHLKQRKDTITWDDKGQVLLNGVLIPKSNISDLISDAMRSRKHFNPVGVQEFYKVLNDINVPKDLVRNERRWTEVSQKGGNWLNNALEGFAKGIDRVARPSKYKYVGNQKGKGWFSNAIKGFAKGFDRAVHPSEYKYVGKQKGKGKQKGRGKCPGWINYGKVTKKTQKGKGWHNHQKGKGWFSDLTEGLAKGPPRTKRRKRPHPKVGDFQGI